MRLIHIAALVLSILIPTGANAQFVKQMRADHLPKADIMPRMRAQSVAKSITFNGLPAHITSFETDESVSDVLNWYDSAWKRLGLATIKRGQFGDAMTIGVEDDEIYYSLQARERESGGAEGAIVVSVSPRVAEPNIKSGFPLMPGAELLNRVESNDFGKAAETLVAYHRKNVAAVAGWYERRLPQEGWLRQSSGADLGYRAPGQDVLTFQRGRELAQISVVPSPEENHEFPSLAVINWTK